MASISLSGCHTHHYLPIPAFLQNRCWEATVMAQTWTEFVVAAFGLAHTWLLAGIQEVNQWMDAVYVCLSLFLCLSNQKVCIHSQHSITSCLSLYQLMDSWVASSVLVGGGGHYLMWTFLWVFHGHIFSYLIVYLWIDHMATVINAGETARLFPKATTTFEICTNHLIFPGCPLLFSPS